MRFATAIIGGAVFVDRVLYGGPDQQRIALGALAGTMARRRAGVGLRRSRALAPAGHPDRAGSEHRRALAMSTWTPTDRDRRTSRSRLAVFGLGFGLTVTPRSTAAVEAVGRRAFGVASATVTVARMIGMAVGLAILTAYGSTDDRSPRPTSLRDARRLHAVHPRGPARPAAARRAVVDALEAWASGEAAQIMVGLFLVAAG